MFVEYPSERVMNWFIVFPKLCVADLRFGSQVIVRESQAAVFFRDGRALDVLGPGRHTICTANGASAYQPVGQAFWRSHPFTC